MTPWLEDTDLTLYVGDALEVLRGLPDGRFVVVQSPEQWAVQWREATA